MQGSMKRGYKRMEVLPAEHLKTETKLSQRGDIAAVKTVRFTTMYYPIVRGSCGRLFRLDNTRDVEHPLPHVAHPPFGHP
jgi:hypothetical protein